MDKEELLRKIMELPKEESKNAVGSFSGINVEDLAQMFERRIISAELLSKMFKFKVGDNSVSES